MGEKPLRPRRLELELAQEHRHHLGEAGWGALLLAEGEAGAWGALLRCPPAVAAEVLPFLEPRARQAVLAELAVARRHRWARRTGQGRQLQAGAKEEGEEEEEEEEEEEHQERECFWCVPGGCCCEQ